MPGPPAGLRAGLARTGATAAASVTERAVTAGYLSGWRLVRLLPERQALALFRRVADEIHRRDGAGVRRLRANLARVRPDLDDAALEELTRDAVRSYLRYWCESFRLPSWPTTDLVSRIRMVDERLLREALDAGRGCVVALPHMANWDWVGAWACAELAPLLTVAERLRPERLYDEFVAYRRSLGITILPLTGGDPTLPRLESWVRGGGLVCLLADRDLSRSGVEVELCGTRAKVPRGPAVLALHTGAPLLPVTLHYDGDELVTTIHPAVPHDHGPDGEAAMMQKVADVFSGALREHPQDWHMMQRVFVEDAGRSR